MKAQKITEKSMTVPGQAISPGELQRRYINGNLPDIAHPVHDNEESFDRAFDIGMSVFDAIELDNSYRDNMSKYLAAKEAEKKEAAEAELFAQLKAKYEPTPTE